MLDGDIVVWANEHKFLENPDNVSILAVGYEEHEA